MTTLRVPGWIYCYQGSSPSLQIVHECAVLLNKCYSTEEIIETKLGQLELTKTVWNYFLKKKLLSENFYFSSRNLYPTTYYSFFLQIFDDLLKLKGDGESPSAIVDLNKCAAFSSMEYYQLSTAAATSPMTQISSILTLSFLTLFFKLIMWWTVFSYLFWFKYILT